MSPRHFKTGCFALAGVNSFATVFYSNYLFYFMRERFGFGNLDCLGLSALMGFLYTFAAWWAGRFAQRRGYFLSLGIGCGGMAAALGAGLFAPTAPAQMLVLVAWTVAVCFTWPPLEALATEGETPEGLGRMVGIYNLVWSGAAALGYFCGGALAENLGWKSLFWLPAALHVAQLAALAPLAKAWRRRVRADGGAGGTAPAPDRSVWVVRRLR